MMNDPLPQHLQTIVDSLCTSGCDDVNGTIEALDKNTYVEETAGLNEKEKNQVLNELKSIMSVYDKDN